MPVTRFKSVEDMPEPPRATSPLEGLAAACAASTMSRAFGHTAQAPRGVRKFISVAAADAERQRWEADGMGDRAGDALPETPPASTGGPF